MRQTKKEKYTNQKVTRWDRIRKRNATKSVPSFKTDVVRNFFEKDYINRYDEEVLCGKKETHSGLSPALVMDMRHEMFRKIPRKLPLATVGGQRTLDACVNHNMVVEERYIVNELNKFRQQLQKNHKRSLLKFKLSKKSDKSIYDMDNNCITQSLERTAKHLENFYTAPLEALQVVEDLAVVKSSENSTAFKRELIMNSDENPFDKDKFQEEDTTNVGNNESHCLKQKNIKNENSSLAEMVENTSEVVNASLSENMLEKSLNFEIKPPPQETCHCNISNEVLNGTDLFATRSVRFVDNVDVRKLFRENSICSNTSDGIDSVVSDLAEEALFELQMEAEEKLSKQAETQVQSMSVETIKKIVPIDTAYPEATEQTTIEPLLITRLVKPKETDSLITTSEDLEEEESISNHEQNLIIEQLFQSRANTNHTLLRKYFLKWIHFITIEKIEREDVSSKGDRIHKINLFLDKIRKEKLRLTRYSRQCNAGQERDAQKKTVNSTVATKKYQNKIKIQQDIIDMQRFKLERQERIIMELKLNKLSDEAKEARQDLKNELKSIIRHGDPKFKAKAKCLQLIGDLRDGKDENMASLQGKALAVPKFLMKMQERALERSIRHEKARQRRVQQEAEKEAQKMAAEEAKRLEDEEAKRVRIEALKEKRRQEKMAKVLKEREHQRALEDKSKADEFYRRLLLRRVGMEGFKQLIIRKRENKRKCEQFRRKIFKRTYFSTWRDYYLKLRTEKQALADELYEKILKRSMLYMWKCYVQDERSKYNVAVDWCDMKRTEITFKLWAQYSARMTAIEAARMKQAKSHHEW
ncbi:unnamed protein product [Ceratitis capitata]|nr:unnamed protein product [Ceratitis capitata]